MMLQDWEFVCGALEKYGVDGPMVDVGGLPNPGLANYFDDTMHRFQGESRCYDHAFRDYSIVNPERDHGMTAEALATLSPRSYRTVITTGTIEHAPSPWAFMWACAGMLLPGGHLILTVPWRWPTHGRADEDFWRISPAGLRQLAAPAPLEVLEAGTFEVGRNRVMSSMVARRTGDSPERHSPGARPKMVVK